MSNAVKRLCENKEGSIRFGEKIIKDLDKNHLSAEMSAEVLFESGIMECEEKEKMYNKVLLLLTI